MASLVLGVAGAAVGSLFGMPQIGFAIGSTVGSVLFPSGQDQKGPRLNDLKVESSAYGTPIPVVYGSSRLSGAIIWSSDLVEHEHEDSAGKGGPTITTYSYSASFASSLCAGPIAGVRRIWSGGTLIYDVSGDSETTSLPNLQLQIYLGDETQLPDPTIEAHLGAGNVPAYRGQAYVVFTDLDLTNYGNSIAGTQLEFEVVTKAEAEAFAGDATLLGPGSVFAIDPTTSYVWTPWSDGTKFYAIVYDVTIPAEIQRIELANAGVGAATIVYVDGYMIIGAKGNHHSPAPILYKVHAPSYDIVATTYSDYPGAVTQLGTVWHNSAGLWLGGHGSSVGGDGYFQIGMNNEMDNSCGGGFGNSGRMHMVQDPYTLQFFCFYGVTGVYIDVEACPPAYFAPSFIEGAITTSADYSVLFGYGNWIWIIPPGGTVGEELVNTDWSIVNQSHRVVPNKTATKVFWCAVGAGSSGVYLADLPSRTMTTIDATADVYAIYYNDDADILYVEMQKTGDSSVAGYLPSDRTVWAYRGNGDGTGAYVKDTSVDYLGAQFAVGQVWGSSAYVGDGAFIGSEYAAMASGRLWIAHMGAGAVVTGGPVTLASIVSDMSVRSGLTVGDIDVSELTDLVDGYTVTRQAPARACIEQLQQAYFFDAVESQDVIKFPKRGRDSSVTIPRTELAAHVVGSGLPDWMSITRKQEVELPRMIDVQYIAISADYQTSNQRSRRMAPLAGDSVSVEIPIVMSDDKAKQVADTLMYNAWIARTAHAFATSRKYAHLEPTDVVTIEGHDIRLVKKLEANGLIKWDGVAESSYVYTQDSAGAGSVGVPTQGVPPLVTTEWVLLDIPLLRDEDNDAGFYLAARGASTPWRGMALYKSSDGGATYSEAERLATASAIGVTMTALGDFTGGNVFDEANTVTITLVGGTLSSTTELAVLNGANAAAISSGDDWEIVQFKKAILNDDGSYTLSGLLRGRKGTEWTMGAHAAGDKFVLLTTAMSRIWIPLAEIGLERQYKGVSVGGTLATASARAFTGNAVGYKPYSPVLLGGGRDAGDNVTINWTRRTRIGGEWRDYVDAAVGESLEKYDVEITDATFTNVLRTFSLVMEQTVSYTAAEQADDGITPGDPVHVRVYQVSSTTGRGTPLEGTV